MNNAWSIQNMSSHFEYLENRLREFGTTIRKGVYCTWPIRYQRENLCIMLQRMILFTFYIIYIYIYIYIYILWFVYAGHCWRSRDELIRDVLLWIPTHGRAKAGRPARTYIQQLCEDTGCCPEDLPRAMNDREEWRERVRDIRATSTIWWWWWDIYIYIYICVYNVCVFVIIICVCISVFGFFV